MLKLFFVGICVSVLNSYHAMSCIDYEFTDSQITKIREKCENLHKITENFKSKNKPSKEKLKKFLSVDNDEIKNIIETDDIYIYEYLKNCVNFTRNNID